MLILFFLYVSTGATHIALQDGQTVLCGGARVWQCDAKNSFTMVEFVPEPEPDPISVEDGKMEHRDLYLILDGIVQDSDVIVQLVLSGSHVARIHKRMINVLGNDTERFLTVCADDSNKCKRATILVIDESFMKSTITIQDIEKLVSPSCRLIVFPYDEERGQPGWFEFSNFKLYHTYRGVVQPELAWNACNRQKKTFTDIDDDDDDVYGYIKIERVK